MSRRLEGTRTRKPKDIANEAPESSVELYVKEKSAQAAARVQVSFKMGYSCPQRSRSG
jgi:hypothetical protein